MPTMMSAMPRRLRSTPQRAAATAVASESHSGTTYTGETKSQAGTSQRSGDTVAAKASVATTAKAAK